MKKNKTKTNKKDNDIKKILITLLIVILIILIIGGATFAYWRWESANNQKTLVNITVTGGTLTITGNNITSEGMYNTADCDGSGSLGGELVTVTAENGTETDMTVFLALRATLTKKYGTSYTVSNTDSRQYLKWALVDTAISGQTCANTPYKGNFAGATTNTDIAVVDTSKNPATTPMTFTATKSRTTTKTYRLYVWLDSSYTPPANVGDTISDPMQELSMKITWSPNSKMVQDPNYTFNPTT